jgi:hypothetical protein
MEYAPFGLADNASWTAATGNAAPVWTIRNGLNDDPQNADTDVANYGKKDDQGVLIKPAANANGAISVAVVNPAASLGAGLYEDGNPWPIAGVGMTSASANDLAAALTYLNTNGVAAKYGAYTIRLGVDPTLPADPDLKKIILGDGTSGASWEYPDITSTALILEEVVPVVMPVRDLLWTLSKGNTVRYGSNVAQSQYRVSDGLVYDFSEGTGYEVLIFTGGSGSVLLTAPLVDLLVVAGGGSGGGNSSQDGAGGGGAGGLVYKKDFAVQAGAYTVTVGAGGAAVPAAIFQNGNPGNPSIFWISSAGAAVNGLSDNGAKATGGGMGAGGFSNAQAGSGGSGGGGAASMGEAYGYGGLATGGTITGRNGANGTTGSAGGGGAGSPGSGKAGGAGLELDITGTPYIYAKGGSGGELGTGNGAAGVNFGDGGAGGGVSTGTGGAGHSGVVVIRWAK